MGSASASVTAGGVIGGCRILRLLGRGGMGEVYLAEHLALRKQVAVKILPRAGGEPGRVERFLREARTCSHVEHPNVVVIHDVGLDQGVYYIVMQYVQGRTLAEVLRDNGGQLPWRSALRLVQLAARGLQAVHDRGLVHRDIKPSNIMLSNDARVLLMDFGLVREERESSLTQSGHVVGTPSFMSPEQCQGKPLDRRSDIYALGSTLYCLLVGQPPYRGTFQEVFAQVIRGKPPKPVWELRSDVPRAVSDLVAKAMAARPDDRFPSAASMAGELKKLLRSAGLPSTATWQRNDVSPEPSKAPRVPDLPPVELLPLETVRDRLERHLPWIGAGSGVLACVLVLVAVLNLSYRHPSVTPAVPGVSPPPSTAPERTPPPSDGASKPQPPPSPPQDRLLNMIRIEAGYAQMGNTQAKIKKHFETIPVLSQTPMAMQQALALASQEPVQKVLVPAFWMDKYEVTNAQYAQFVQQSGAEAPDGWKGKQPPQGKENCPVENIRHRDAEAYAQWAGKMLPTRAQWLRAFRGENDWLFPWGDDFDVTRANVAENSGFPSSSPVDATPRDVSSFGVYNLVGNVAEFLREKNSVGGQTMVHAKGAAYCLVPGAAYGVACMHVMALTSGASPGVGFRCVIEEPLTPGTTKR